MLVLFVDDPASVPCHGGEEILSGLLDPEGIELRVDGIPLIFIGIGIHDIDAGKSPQESFRDPSEDRLAVRVLVHMLFLPLDQGKLFSLFCAYYTQRTACLSIP